MMPMGKPRHKWMVSCMLSQALLQLSAPGLAAGGCSHTIHEWVNLRGTFRPSYETSVTFRSYFALLCLRAFAFTFCIYLVSLIRSIYLRNFKCVCISSKGSILEISQFFSQIMMFKIQSVIHITLN